MTKQTINLGKAPTGSGGDTPRSAFVKTQENIDELYAMVIDVNALPISSTDLNVLLILGVYSFSHPVANGPGFSQGTIEVQPRKPDEVIQIARDINSDAVATRRYVNGSWTAWVRRAIEGLTVLPEFSADLNTLVSVGTYAFSQPQANGPGFDYGTIDVQPRSPNEVIQIARDISSNVVVSRRYFGGNWTSWTREYVEIIENVNGNATKFPDGTLLCNGNFTMPLQNLNTPSFGAYITFAIAFIDTDFIFLPVPQAVIGGGGSQNAVGCLQANGMYFVKTSGATVTVNSYAYRYTVDMPVLCSYMAKGRWY